MKKIDVIQGDCLEILPTLPSESIDLCIADPPYKLEMPDTNGVNSLLKGKNINLVNEDWDKFTLEDYMVFTEQWIQQVVKLLKPTGSVVVFGTYHNIGLINYVIQKLNYMIINDIIWFKRNAVPNLACRRLTASSEQMLWFSTSKSYTFNYHTLKDGDFPEDNLKKPGKQMRNVWDIPHRSP